MLLELQRPQLQNFFSVNSKKDVQIAQERQSSKEKEHSGTATQILKEKINDTSRMDDSFNFIPSGKNNNMTNPMVNSKNTVTIVPIHTPISSPENDDEISSKGRIEERNTVKERSGLNHKKILSSGSAIPIGREVVVVNNRETVKVERTPLQAYQISPNASYQNLNSRGKGQRAKQQKIRNISMNLSIEHPKPQLSRLELSSYNLSTNPVRGSGEELETRIKGIMSNKTFDVDQVQEINGLFEEFTNNLNETSSCKEVRSQKEALRQIRVAYEKFFQNYAAHEQSQLKKVTAERNELLTENLKIRNELKEASEELRGLRGSSQGAKTFSGPGNIIPTIQLKKISHSPSPSEVLTANKKNSIDQMDTPPITKNPGEGDRERETLRSIISTQQKTINSLKKKEMNVARIMEACKQFGIDIESICNEEIKAVLDNQYHNNTSEEYDLPTLNKNTAHPSKSLLRTKNNSIHKSDKTEGEDLNHLHSEAQSSRSIQDSGIFSLSNSMFLIKIAL